MAQLANVCRVRTLTSIRRARMLPRAGQVMVPVGREVEAVHVVARGPADNAFTVMRASNVLRVAPEDVAGHLLVKEGDSLEKGQPLLRKQAAFGRSKIYRSPVDGTLMRVRDGYLVLQRSDQVAEVRALLRGRVVSIIPDRGVVIEAIGSLVQAVWDSGMNGTGRLQRSVGNAEETLTVEQVGPEAAGSIYVAGLVESVDVLDSLEERGARGLVAGSMPAAVCAQVGRYSFPVFLTEGIGKRPMAEPIFELLQRSEGRNASMLAASRLYQEQRAEVVIPLPTAGSLPQMASESMILETGALVRVNGISHGTTLGRVAKVHAQPRKTTLGIVATGADVVFTDGTVLFVPYPNLDIIG